MIKNAIIAGTFKDRKIFYSKLLISFKRAGADAIISYFALDTAKILKKGF